VKIMSFSNEGCSELVEAMEALCRGDISFRMREEGDSAQIAAKHNRFVEMLTQLMSELARLHREYGAEGLMGGQAEVEGAEGAWRELVDNANEMGYHLTVQLRDMSRVTHRALDGDFSHAITVQAGGETAEFKDNLQSLLQRLAQPAG
jgi:HAMP domain-containing protein